MTRFLTLVVLLALVTPMQVKGSSSRRRAVVPTSLSVGAGSRILWVGAHPDDEAVAAPLLGTLCVEAGAECSFLVLTRGEAGVCLLPGGCAPGLGTVRAAEMQKSAAIFGAAVTQWEFRDVMTGVVESWAVEAGGREALVSMIRDVIIRERSDTVLTFDPKHGTSCHAAHRATAALVIEAIEGIDVDRPALFLLETTVAFNSEGVIFGSALVPGSPAIVIAADSTWHYLVTVAANHASQFTDADLEALRAVPVQSRRLVVSPLQWPRTYAATCP